MALSAKLTRSTSISTVLPSKEAWYGLRYFNSPAANPSPLRVMCAACVIRIGNAFFTPTGDGFGIFYGVSGGSMWFGQGNFLAAPYSFSTAGGGTRGLMGFPHLFNGSTWDRQRTIAGVTSRRTPELLRV